MRRSIYHGIPSLIFCYALNCFSSETFLFSFLKILIKSYFSRFDSEYEKYNQLKLLNDSRLGSSTGMALADKGSAPQPLSLSFTPLVSLPYSVHS